MENIVVFKASPPYRDGGSRDEICTNVGIFSLIKKLKNPGNRNGFYIGGLKASEQLSSELEVALNNFLSKDETYSIKSKTKIEPQIELIIENNKVDTLYVYRAKKD